MELRTCFLPGRRFKGGKAAHVRVIVMPFFFVCECPCVSRFCLLFAAAFNAHGTYVNPDGFYRRAHTYDPTILVMVR